MEIPKFFYDGDGTWVADIPGLKDYFKKVGNEAAFEKVGDLLISYAFSLPEDMGSVFGFPTPIRLFVPRYGWHDAAYCMVAYLGVYYETYCDGRTCDEWIANHIVHPMLKTYGATWHSYYGNGFPPGYQDPYPGLVNAIRRCSPRDEITIARGSTGWLTITLQGMANLMADGHADFVERFFAEMEKQDPTLWTRLMKQAAHKGDPMRFAERILITRKRYFCIK